MRLGIYGFSVLVGNNWGLSISSIKSGIAILTCSQCRIELRLIPLLWKVTLRKCLLGASSSTCVNSPRPNRAYQVKGVGEHH